MMNERIEQVLSEGKKINHIKDRFNWKEPVYEDFISREEFINRTGIFVTPEHFRYIYDVEFKESKLSVDEFVNSYEESHCGEVVEMPLKGVFKYCILDDNLSCIDDYDASYEPNIWEIINCLSRSYTSMNESKGKTIETYKQIITEIQLSQKEPTALC